MTDRDPMNGKDLLAWIGVVLWFLARSERSEQPAS